MSSPTKVLFLAIDAADKLLIHKWAADGTLPTIRSLLATGLVGETMSLEGLYEGSTWPSFYTGVNPACHGFYSLTQLNPGTYEFYRCYPGDFIKREPFWNYLSGAGRKVAILDIPLSGISKELNGIQMVEWGSHDGIYGFCSWPYQLKQDVLAKFGSHPLTRSCDSFGRIPQELPAFKNLLVEGVLKKAKLTNHFLNQGGWDFFAQVFTESHCVGHQCWHLHDPSHPGYDPEIASIMGDPLRDVYVAIDTAIGEILAQVDQETIVFLLVAHRMAHYFGMQCVLPEILCRLKVAKKPSEEISTDKFSKMFGRLENILTCCWRYIPNRIKKPLGVTRHRLRGWIDRHQGRSSPMFFGIDPRKSKCFMLHNGASVCGLRVNLAGREPEGLIQPGDEMDIFCNQLGEDLLEIVNLDTGNPAVKSVKRTGKVYQGEYLDHLPDLLVEWSDEKPLGNTATMNRGGSKVRLASEKIGVVEGVNTYCRTGDHRPEGIFIAFGPGIKPGRLERTVSIMDFVPTFINLFGLEISCADGNPITEILQMLKYLR
jgi:predicted AlkP superfamily phosphohydrolase/phosphomutase